MKKICVDNLTLSSILGTINFKDIIKETIKGNGGVPLLKTVLLLPP